MSNDFSHITDDMLFSAIRKIANAAPDTLYRDTVPAHQVTGSDRCFYVHTDTDGQPVEAGCIIGKALHSLGVPLETLKTFETKSANRVLADLGIGDGVTQYQARRVQWEQDSGETWAVAAAKLPAKAEAAV